MRVLGSTRCPRPRRLHLTTDVFFSALCERLTPAGVLVVNLGLDGHTNAIISGRIQAEFGCGARACVSTPVDANILVFATTNAVAPWQAPVLSNSSEHATDRLILNAH